MLSRETEKALSQTLSPGEKLGSEATQAKLLSVENGRRVIKALRSRNFGNFWLFYHSGDPHGLIQSSHQVFCYVGKAKS